ncbi:glutamate-rich protein 5 [Sorex araneus]|uniref:glutamate-rich protein 5 n=1 Tax=Sorex araneus TaxID=42254 RepID=UPI002433C62E|nr:glutamate-rich protein 5 [Sorex araneus]
MGCSSSALHKARDSNRRHREESASGAAQPKPQTVSKESNSYDPVQRGHPAPREKLQVSAASAANGLGAHPGQPPCQGTADPPPSGPTEQGAARPGGRREAESKAEGQARTETPPGEGVPEAQGPASGTAGEPEGPAAEDGNQGLPAEVPPGGAVGDGPPDSETEALGQPPPPPPEETTPSQMGAEAPLQEATGPGATGQGPLAAAATGRPAGTLETEASEDAVGGLHACDKGGQDREGETGDVVRTETADEKVSGGAETQEEETGEAVGVPAGRPEGGDAWSQ